MNRICVKVMLGLMDGRNERKSTELCSFRSYFFFNED